VRRDTGAKNPISLEGIESTVSDLLNVIHDSMYAKAKATYDSHIKEVTKWEDVVPALDAKNVVAIPWCDVEACEDDIKERSAQA